MTDKDMELTTLAAKAAGIQLELGTTRLAGNMQTWRPLTDDGDALRLAVKLGLDVEMHGCKGNHPYACAFDCEHNIAEEEQPHDGDPYAATRRAIVRAAAGRQKPLLVMLANCFALRCMTEYSSSSLGVLTVWLQF